MLDWNGNGEIDSVDIGISIATQKETKTEKAKEEYKKSNIGCMASVLFVVGLIAVTKFFI